MKILGIESSCDQVSIALLADGQIRERAVEGGKTPTDHLIPAVLALLGEYGIDMAALDAIALGVGPGAFTSLRLGCSVAQGFALASDVGIVPVCSLDVIAAAQSAPQVLVAADARMGEAYVAAYQREADGRYRCIAEPACMPPERVALPGEGAWCGVGTAFAQYADTQLAGVEGLTVLDPTAVPRAADLVRLAAHELASGGTAQDPTQVGPRYVRDKVAQTVAERLAQGGKA